MPRPSLFLAVSVCAASLGAAALSAALPGQATASPPPARPPGGPHVAWWLSNAASAALVHPGERLSYTVRLHQVRSLASVTDWLCATTAGKADCIRVNERDVGNPIIVDDLAPVMQHAAYRGDARGAAGTAISVERDGTSTVITARPSRPGAAADVSFTFRVTVSRSVRPGTVIRNVAQVM